MGLDTTHDCWHGPYSRFSQFRNAIAEAAGIPLGLMEGFAYAETWGNTPERITQWLPLSWDLFKGDAIVILLNHSDCEGEIAAGDCGPLADRLVQLREAIDGDWHQKVDLFVGGLRAAADAVEDVEFQ